MPPSCRSLLQLITICGGLLSAIVTSAVESPFSDPHQWIGENLVLAGPLDLPALKDSFPGAVVIIDLRTAEEGTAAEQSEAQVLGLSYHSLPVAGATVFDEQVTALEELLSAAPQDALVVLHCASGNRAGMLWAATELRQGRDVDDVLEQLAPVVTKPPVIEAVRSYAEGLTATH